MSLWPFSLNWLCFARFGPAMSARTTAAPGPFPPVGGELALFRTAILAAVVTPAKAGVQEGRGLVFAPGPNWLRLNRCTACFLSPQLALFGGSPSGSAVLVALAARVLSGPGGANWVRLTQGAIAIPLRASRRPASRLSVQRVRLALFSTARLEHKPAVTLLLQSTWQSSVPPRNWLCFARLSPATAKLPAPAGPIGFVSHVENLKCEV